MIPLTNHCINTDTLNLRTPDGVLRFQSFPLIPPNILFLIKAEQFSLFIYFFCQTTGHSTSPDILNLLHMWSCKLCHQSTQLTVSIDAFFTCKYVLSQQTHFRRISTAKEFNAAGRCRS